MDATEEVNNRRTARGLLGAAFTKEHVRQQHAEAWAWVRFNQEEDRFTGFGCLLNAQR